MEFFASHDLPLCFLPSHSWRYEQHPALSATVLRMFSVFVAPELSLASLSSKLFVIRTKSKKLIQYYFQNTRGTERVKCPRVGVWISELERFTGRPFVLVHDDQIQGIWV